MKILDSQFYRLSEDTKANYKQLAEEEYDFEFATMGITERGFYKLVKSTVLPSGIAEATYEYHAGGLITFQSRNEKLYNVSFKEGIEAWAEKDKPGPTEEMRNELKKGLREGLNEEEVKEAAGDYYRTLYAEDVQGEGVTRFYALFPRCMLKVVFDRDNKVKQYELLTQEEAKQTFANC